MKYYKLTSNQHLGDAIALLSFIINKDEDFTLFSKDNSKLNFFKELLSLFDTKLNVQFKDSPENNEYTNICKNPILVSHLYSPTKTKWKNINSNKITYNFDCNWKVEEKVPQGINDLTKKINMVKVGLPMNLENTVKELSTSKIFLASDNGIAHLARCVGVPVIFIEHKYSMEFGHPQQFSKFKKVQWTNLEETSEKIKLMI